MTGDVGPTGSIGLKGDIGATGAKGDIGPTGLAGPTGASGSKGDIGRTGPTGLKGDSGVDGVTGSLGPTGPKGEIGLTGSTGLKGQKGEFGPGGSNGVDGVKGEQGVKGQKGAAADNSTVEAIAKLPTNFLDFADANYYDGSIWSNRARVRDVTLPSDGSVYWAVDAQTDSPGAYLWIWISNKSWNETSNGNIIQFTGQTPSVGPGFWRTNKFVPGIPTTLTESAGWPEGGQNGYPAYPGSSNMENIFN